MVIRAADKGIHVRAKKAGMRTIVAASGFPDEEFDRAVLVGPGVKIPWHLLEYGFHFLERWDAAVPLWRYGGVAEKVGSKAERARTQKVALDLRLLLCAPELLFVRGSGDGLRLMQTWQAEIDRFVDAEQRLAFLRAQHIVKPRLYVLPRSWLGVDQKKWVQQEKRLAGAAGDTRKRRRKTGSTLIRLEVAPGRFVRCAPADVEKAQRLYHENLSRRERKRR